MEWHEILRTWAAVVISGGSLAWMVWWSIRQAGKSATKTTQDALDHRIAKLETAVQNDEKADSTAFTEMKARLQSVEDELKHMPSKEQFHSLQISISDLKADFRELAANLKPLAASVERMNDFLMERKA